MKTKPAKKTKLKINVQKTSMPPPDVCAYCGAPAYGQWIDVTSGKRYLWCKLSRCEMMVQKTAPLSVHARFQRIDRVRTVTVYDGPNEIVVSNSEKPSVHGRNARYCYEAWDKSIFPTGFQKLLDLYKAEPEKLFLLYNADGELLGRTKSRAVAEAQAGPGSEKIMVYWGGK